MVEARYMYLCDVPCEKRSLNLCEQYKSRSFQASSQSDLRAAPSAYELMRPYSIEILKVLLSGPITGMDRLIWHFTFIPDMSEQHLHDAE